ncbi:peptidylprolyl isomerase [Priestia megaterium]|jgi:foldase protein PrsA|uniref:Foldase protein PrsA n=1 Tax=Priestia megaterium (strain DSM 319 / IMG 1521) TaxID=592022 RepID=D5DE32_PRIM3|nr:peptidylprolyl isomerase [Priestia megaterium]ADF38861.1 foldase protein PrsA [Priestia megaterium DSM 319]MED3942034.1 peptidylprolyl isomerase [Priestia megaterium]MED4215056.1 peptidylprolyl isomerase [Priestia megaterium]WEZ38035.1 peptidylprolyl isomerase [Priestia megaterium DSM 319]
MSKNKIIMIIAAVVIIAAVAIGAVAMNKSKVVATVGDEKITKDQLYDALLAQGGSSVLDSLIEQKVISKEAAKQNIKVTDKEINAELENLKSQYGGEDALNQALASSGVKLSELKKDLKTNIEAKKMVESTINIKDSEMKSYFDQNKDSLATEAQVKASHILVADEKTAKEVKAKLDKGEDFAKLAKEYSTDTASKSNGGDLGYFKKGDMVEAFANQAFSMKVNEVSDPVKTEYGYHIIKVTGKKEAQKATYENSKAKIKQTLLDQKYQTEYPTWLQKLKKKYDITNKLDS